MPDLISVYKTSPATTFVLGADLVSQNVAGNYSTVRFYLKATNGPGGTTGSQFNNWGQQQGHVEGLVHFGTHSGQPFLPGGYGNGAQRWLDSWDVNIGHGADGTRGPITARMYLGYGNVNESHYATFNNFPRIPKAPGAPVSLGIDEVTSSSFRYRFSGTHDGGGGITGWQAQRATDANFTQNVQTVESSGTTAFTGLTPNNTYWARSRGYNPYGYSPWSDALSVKIGLPAPTLTSWAQDSTGALVAKWTAPSATNGLTGYRLQTATDANFTQNVRNRDVGNVLTGAITGLPGGRTYYVRVAALTGTGVNAWSGTLNTILILDSGDLDGWTRFGPKPANVGYYTAEGIRRGVFAGAQALALESLATGSATLTPMVHGMQRVVTGLTVGKAYRFEAWGALTESTQVFRYALKVVNEETLPSVTIGTDATDLGFIEFVADATSATLQILSDSANSGIPAGAIVESAVFSRIKLLELDTDFPQRLRGTVYESNLANHFDLASNSVGATWHVGKDGITRFTLPGSHLPVSAVFSDEPTAFSVSYVDITAGYDTRTTVNRIEATNYGVDPDEDVEENDELVVEDIPSQITYGVYRSALALNLYDEAPYDESFSERLDSLLEQHKTPQARVSSIRWNAQEDLALANALDVGQRITVRYRGSDYDSQIVNIQHDITPTRWMVTLTLQSL